MTEVDRKSKAVTHGLKLLDGHHSGDHRGGRKRRRGRRLDLTSPPHSPTALEKRMRQNRPIAHSPRSIALALAIALLAVPVYAQSRIALIIGNGLYPGGSRLVNPVRDAEGMAGKLRELGYEVELHTDQTATEMRGAIKRFYAAAAGKQGTLLYFAGHGKQARGVNLLLPIDVTLVRNGVARTADELLQAAVPLDDVVDQAAQSASPWNLIIVDACRDDVRAARSLGDAPGFAPVAAPTGTLLAFSTAPGQLAKDGAPGTNGLYTSYLLKHMVTPGLAVEQMFKRVRADVVRDSTAAGRQQVPWESTSLVGELSIAGPIAPLAVGATR